MLGKDRIHYMELKAVPLHGAGMLPFTNPLHGVESDGLVRGEPRLYLLVNPLHGVESKN